MSMDFLPFGLGFGEVAIFLILLIVGIIAILLLKTLIHFVVPIVAAVAAWYFTHSLAYAGAAFVAVAIIQWIVKRPKVKVIR